MTLYFFTQRRKDAKNGTIRILKISEYLLKSASPPCRGGSAFQNFSMLFFSQRRKEQKKLEIEK